MKSESVYLLCEFFKIGEFPSRYSVFSAKIFTTDCTFATCTYTTWRYALWNTGSFAVKFRWKFLERFFFHFLFFFLFSFQAFDIRWLSVFLGLIVVIIRRFIRFERFNRIADNEASSKRTDRSNLFKIFCFVCERKKGTPLILKRNRDEIFAIFPLPILKINRNSIFLIPF